MGLIFAEFTTSLTSSLRVLEIVKVGLSENLTHLPSVIFAKISRREKFPIYGMSKERVNKEQRFSERGGEQRI